MVGASCWSGIARLQRLEDEQGLNRTTIDDLEGIRAKLKTGPPMQVRLENKLFPDGQPMYSLQVDGSRLIGPWASSVLETEIGGDTSLYNPATETVTVLNATASDIWRLCQERTTLGEAVAALAKAYDIDGESIAGEVIRVISDLTRQGFLLAPEADRAEPG